MVYTFFCGAGKREKLENYGLEKRKMVALVYLILQILKIFLVRTWNVLRSFT